MQRFLRRVLLTPIEQTCIEFAGQLRHGFNLEVMRVRFQWMAAAIVISSPLYEACSTFELSGQYLSLADE